MDEIVGVTPEQLERYFSSREQDANMDEVLGLPRATDTSQMNPDTALLKSYRASHKQLHHLVYTRRANLKSARTPVMGYTRALHMAAVHGEVENVKWMLEHGAPWNIVCTLKPQTPAEAALSVGQKACYDIIFEHAVKTEYARFYDPYRPPDMSGMYVDIVEKLYDSAGFLKMPCHFLNPRASDPKFEEDFAMVMSNGVGVMMEWERPIMKESVRLLFQGFGKGKKCLNVGFGLGILDTYMQHHSPSEHIIIEAHPSCLAYMRTIGWYSNPSVRILEGKWQDFLLDPKKCEQLGLNDFDVIYFDTFNEGYRDHLQFFELVGEGLLKRGVEIRFSFFHAAGRSHELSYKVYAEMTAWHLNDVGLRTSWHEIQIDPKTVWWRPDLPTQIIQEHEKDPWLIPVCTLSPTVIR